MYYYYCFYSVRYSIFALRCFTLALSFLCFTYTTEFFVGGPDSQVIPTTLPPYKCSPDDRGTTVVLDFINAEARRFLSACIKS
jgi:hypothetical protein